MIYDLIIIGAGAAGLFAGASLPFPVNGLIIEKKSTPGRKLLMSGAGQCNLTHGGSIKDFIPHYGSNGTKIRSVLYRFNNLSVIDFFESKDIPLFAREDEKIFPKSLKSQDVLQALVEGCGENGLRFLFSSPVDRITVDDQVYTVHCGSSAYATRKLIIATGGCSYPATGSDGSLFPVLQDMGIAVTPLTPALVPIYAADYPYRELSGISFQNAEVTIHSHTRTDALLLTHNFFSGPAILNLSRYARPGDLIRINYFPCRSEEVIRKELTQAMAGNSRQLLTALYDYFKQASGDPSAEIPKRFLELICKRAGIDPSVKASRTTHAQLNAAIRLIVRDEFRIQKLGGYEAAMVTAGGVSLSEINLKSMESTRYPNLFFAGEVLDVDGDTGGYNLQFAFSSGHLVSQHP